MKLYWYLLRSQIGESSTPGTSVRGVTAGLLGGTLRRFPGKKETKHSFLYLHINHLFFGSSEIWSSRLRGGKLMVPEARGATCVSRWLHALMIYARKFRNFQGAWRHKSMGQKTYNSRVPRIMLNVTCYQFFISNVPTLGFRLEKWSNWCDHRCLKSSRKSFVRFLSDFSLRLSPHHRFQ